METFEVGSEVEVQKDFLFPVRLVTIEESYELVGENNNVLKELGLGNLGQRIESPSSVIDLEELLSSEDLSAELKSVLVSLINQNRQLSERLAKIEEQIGSDNESSNIDIDSLFENNFEGIKILVANYHKAIGAINGYLDFTKLHINNDYTHLGRFGNGTKLKYFIDDVDPVIRLQYELIVEGFKNNTFTKKEKAENLLDLWALNVRVHLLRNEERLTDLGHEVYDVNYMRNLFQIVNNPTMQQIAAEWDERVAKQIGVLETDLKKEEDYKRKYIGYDYREERDNSLEIDKLKKEIEKYKEVMVGSRMKVNSLISSKIVPGQSVFDFSNLLWTLENNPFIKNVRGELTLTEEDIRNRVLRLLLADDSELAQIFGQETEYGSSEGLEAAHKRLSSKES